MHRMIFVNLPVEDLDASKAFFAALGFSIDRTSPTRRPPA
jgi:predicted lactoylglutathione lyase